MNSVTDIWNRVLELLKTDLTTVAIDTWFSDCSPVDIRDNELILHCPSKFKKDVIEGRFLPIIKNALFEIFSGEFKVIIVTDDEIEKYRRAEKENSESNYDIYTFERFVVGNSNKFAHAAAKAVAEGFVKDYNPLFIYGDSGLGKTHLLHAIRIEMRKKHPEYNIVYVKGDDFTNELISAIQSGKNMEFREKYRNADLFLMDDIQFIAGKIQTQEEFFHTFNTLYEFNRQIVFTSDRPPTEISRLEDRLKTRFESGLLADIQPPDYETRMAIIRNKATQLGTIIEDDIANYVAQNITSNVRQIEGAVKKLKAYQDLMGEKLTISDVTKLLEDFYRDSIEAPTPDLIIEETAKYFSLTSDDLKGQNRARNIVNARQTAMYIIRKLTNLSLVDIGDSFNGRDHSTVFSSIRKVEESISASRESSQMIKDIISNINSRN